MIILSSSFFVFLKLKFFSLIFSFDKGSNSNLSKLDLSLLKFFIFNVSSKFSDTAEFFLLFLSLTAKFDIRTSESLSFLSELGLTFAIFLFFFFSELMSLSLFSSSSSSSSSLFRSFRFSPCLYFFFLSRDSFSSV